MNVTQLRNLRRDGVENIVDIAVAENEARGHTAPLTAAEQVAADDARKALAASRKRSGYVPR
ncbi:hypothetical protein BH23ACT10_BH23ACT10_39060 [soil metagenome]